MKNCLRYGLTLWMLACWASLKAEPTLQAVKVSAAALQMSTNDILQKKPFECEGGYFTWKEKTGLEPFGLTDAVGATNPVDNVYAAPPAVYRWDLGSLGTGGRQLNTIKVWWTLLDPPRKGINIRFAVHDATTGEWRYITPVYTEASDWVSEPGYYKVLTITFPSGEVTNFDSLRLYDNNSTTTRFIEVDAFTTPNNR